MSSESPFKSTLSHELNEEMSKELEKLDPQARKVAEGIRAFQTIARERDSLQGSCADLTAQLKTARDALQRAKHELEAAQRERDHYLKMLSACAAQSQILSDTAAAMMAKLNTLPEHARSSQPATLASRLAVVNAAE